MMAPGRQLQEDGKLVAPRRVGHPAYLNSKTCHGMAEHRARYESEKSYLHLPVIKTGCGACAKTLAEVLRKRH